MATKQIKVADSFTRLPKLKEAFTIVKCEDVDAVASIDCTGSNNFTGGELFKFPMHQVTPGQKPENPYIQALRAIGTAIKLIDTDGSFKLLGFGDKKTKNTKVFKFTKNPLKSMDECITAYRSKIGTLTLSGPTSFAAIIRATIQDIRNNWGYRVLFIMSDGAVDDECKEETRAAIIEASNYPLSISIICVGIADFTEMKKYDEKIPDRRFDNVNTTIWRDYYKDKTDEKFTCAILGECPKQFLEIKRLGLDQKPTTLDSFTPVEELE
jgi:hypothetical protein